MCKEEILKKMIKNLPLDSPSMDFNHQLMLKIQNLQQSRFNTKINHYLFISLMLIFFFGLIFYIPTLENKGIVTHNLWNIHNLQQWLENVLIIKTIFLSKTFVYSIVAVCFYILLILANFKRI